MAETYQQVERERDHLRGQVSSLEFVIGQQREALAASEQRVRELQDKYSRLERAIIEECILTEAVTPCLVDPKSTIREIVDWHCAVATECARDVIEKILSCEWQECTCEACPECGNTPHECSGTKCASTCSCRLCEHCCANDALASLGSPTPPKPGAGETDDEEAMRVEEAQEHEERMERRRWIERSNES